MRYRIIITEQPDRKIAAQKLAQALLAAARAKHKVASEEAVGKQEKAS